MREDMPEPDVQAENVEGSPAAAVRALVLVGLARVEAIEETLRRAMIKEGVRLGQKRLREKLVELSAEASPD